jgi:hypothetical protein
MTNNQSSCSWTTTSIALAINDTVNLKVVNTGAPTASTLTVTGSYAWGTAALA